ncbi:ArpU family phage transcriptional regulator [Paenibacillus jamilae]|jgi:ArpU family phage transcriptional regulator|nr:MULTISPECIES: ArpU family phage packaging/lysis transcriptional regulator [Paenibacillus]MDP9676042.1 ArpU family phage transcriptional regulator [Paenibacillus jamilae]KAF6565894.1 transcriptional regulator [Paenibacillus sp. EKM202P]KAF6572589.1 transcriptional regulator [Paenibacillus sp. EKM207P]KAF6618422.1 transcriptional regulator [Paenibacillus sp. EKM101P]KAF6624768.1 transcriptional regulator [Paenibacillus sp. EKM102P]
MRNNLPELDRRKTQNALEGVFEKYRIYKTITFMDRESFITAGYTDRPNGPTNVTSDPTARTAVYNVDAPAARLAYCQMVDAVVSRLNEREQLLIRERYLKDDDVFDYKVYNYVLDPPVSKDTYTKLRTRAFYKMALALADQGVLNLASLQKGADRRLG